MTNTDDLMSRARQVLADEESARLQAKATELATADERARLEAERQTQREKLRAEAEAALSAEGVTLPDLANKFDATVAALADLAEAACTRNALVRQHATALPNAQRIPERELLARATAQAASKVCGREPDLGRLITSLNADGGPLWRTTAVENARRS
ncbi:hypothetical protein ABT147_18605 [Streptomyces sp. NPDC001868]|uniref:hypothetical protein n=1 Tax=Streptomyces sp. NPDC001868 TaxID=3154401 RepID=UPI003334054E